MLESKRVRGNEKERMFKKEREREREREGGGVNVGSDKTGRTSDQKQV